MLHALMNLLSVCLKPFGRGADKLDSVGVIGNSFGGREGKEGLLWFRDVGKYGSGDFSMAVVQANQVLEDQSQIVSGPLGTFVGIYDGHGGPEASRYVCDHLFRNFQGFSLDSEPTFFSFLLCLCYRPGFIYLFIYLYTHTHELLFYGSRGFNVATLLV